MEFLVTLVYDSENPDMETFLMDTEQTSCPVAFLGFRSAVTSRQ